MCEQAEAGEEAAKIETAEGGDEIMSQFRVERLEVVQDQQEPRAMVGIEVTEGGPVVDKGRELREWCGLRGRWKTKNRSGTGK